jgi:pyridoxamine 5'-phosphate oxidase
MNIADLRKSYEKAELSEAPRRPTRCMQFDQWLKEAIASEVPEPNAMTAGHRRARPAPQHPRGADQGL